MNQVLRWFGLDPFTRVDRINDFWLVPEDWLPTGVILFVLALGLATAAINFHPAIKLHRRVRMISFVLRLGMVALLLLVMLRTHLKLDIQTARDPNWLALVDDSGSMRTADVNGASRFRAAVQDLDAVRKEVGGQVSMDVATLSAQPLGEEAGEKTPTYIHDAILRELAARPRLQRLILLTDGLDGGGQVLSTAGEVLKSRGVAIDVGLYGTDKPALDARISVRPERNVIRLGEPLVIQGSLIEPSGKTSTELTLEEDGKVVQKVTVARESYKWFEVVYRPQKAGLHRYSLSMQAADAYQGNNSISFIVEVRDEKIRVLMIEGEPRFEFKLMKVAIETDPLVHLVTICHPLIAGLYVQGGPLHKDPGQGIIESEAELYNYDIVILRDVPRVKFRNEQDRSETAMKLLVKFVQKRGGGLVVLGGQEVYRAGEYQDSPLAAILPFDLSTHFGENPQFPGRFSVNVVNDLYNHPLLRLLPDPIENRVLWKSLPQLDGCNNVGAIRPMAKSLLSRNVEFGTEHKRTEAVPVMALQDLGEGKVLASSVDTFWHWQLQPEFEPPPLETLMANIVRYLAPEPGLRAGELNIVAKDPTPMVGQTVVLSTLLRDKNYDPQSAEFKVLVIKPDGQHLTIYPRDLPKGLYEYRFEVDQPGVWSATAVRNKEKRETKFVVRARDDEYARLSVDRESMKVLTNAAGGEVVEDIKAWLGRTEVEPVREPAVRDLEVWNSPAILFLFLLLVCVDCYVRKRHGLA